MNFLDQLAALFMPQGAQAMPAGPDMSAGMDRPEAMPLPPFAQPQPPSQPMQINPGMAGAGGGLAGGATPLPPAQLPNLKSGVPLNAGPALPPPSITRSPLDKFARAVGGGLSTVTGNTGGGAFARGMGGTLQTGTKNDDSDFDRGLKAVDTSNKINTARSMDKYRQGLLSTKRDANDLRAAGLDRKSWDKPSSERWNDASRAIATEDARLRKNLGLDGYLSKEARGAAEAKYRQMLGDFTKRTYRKNGFDDNGDDIAGNGQAKPGTVQGPRSQTPTGPRAAAAQPEGHYKNPFTPTSKEDFASIPANSYYIDPGDGNLYVKNPTDQ